MADSTHANAEKNQKEARVSSPVSNTTASVAMLAKRTIKRKNATRVHILRPPSRARWLITAGTTNSSDSINMRDGTINHTKGCDNVSFDVDNCAIVNSEPTVTIARIEKPSAATDIPAEITVESTG